MNPALQSPQIQSSHAILISDGNCILQLRDSKPTIAAPGQWSLFGGKIKAGETPLRTIQREIYEELSIRPTEYTYLWYEDYYSAYVKAIIRSWFFASNVTTVWPSHKLQEGEAVRAFRFEELAGLEMPQIMYQTLERFHRQQERGF